MSWNRQIRRQLLPQPALAVWRVRLSLHARDTRFDGSPERFDECSALPLFQYLSTLVPGKYPCPSLIVQRLETEEGQDFRIGAFARLRGFDHGAKQSQSPQNLLPSGSIRAMNL